MATIDGCALLNPRTLKELDMDWYWIVLIVLYSCCFGFCFIDSILISLREDSIENVTDMIGMVIVAFTSGVLAPLIVPLRLDESYRRR